MIGGMNNLKELKPGDTISLISEDGREYTYAVFANFPVGDAAATGGSGISRSRRRGRSGE